MPATTVFVVSLVVVAFTLFGGGLAFVDFWSRNHRTPLQTPAAEKAARDARKAAKQAACCGACQNAAKGDQPNLAHPLLAHPLARPCDNGNLAISAIASRLGSNPSPGLSGNASQPSLGAMSPV